MLTANLEHSWRWRESNPRLPSSWWDFSERSRCFGVGRGAGHRHPAVAPSSFGVLAGPEALPASEPLSMTPRPSERQARCGRATQGYYAAIAMLSLAFVFGAGSFATIRRRRLASPTSILEIEATHPLVKPSAAGVRVPVRPSKRHTSYSPRAWHLSGASSSSVPGSAACSARRSSRASRSTSRSSTGRTITCSRRSCTRSRAAC